MENILKKQVKHWRHQGLREIFIPKKDGTTRQLKVPTIADDMVVILKPKENASEILAKIEQFLAEREMNVSQRKTKVTASTDGFDFHGWNFFVQRQNGKFRCVPSVENFKAYRKCFVSWSRFMRACRLGFPHKGDLICRISFIPPIPQLKKMGNRCGDYPFLTTFS